MSESTYVKLKKVNFNESFKTRSFIVKIIYLFLWLLSLVFVKEGKLSNILFYLMCADILFISLSIVGYLIVSKDLKHEYLVKNEKFEYKWKSFTLDGERFRNECSNGLHESYIKIKDIHKIEVQLDEQDKKIMGFIDGFEINSLDKFLNYEIEKGVTLQDLSKVTFLECNGESPKNYFVNKRD